MLAADHVDGLGLVDDGRAVRHHVSGAIAHARPDQDAVDRVTMDRHGQRGGVGRVAGRGFGAAGRASVRSLPIGDWS